MSRQDSLGPRPGPAPSPKVRPPPFREASRAKSPTVTWSPGAGRRLDLKAGAPAHLQEVTLRPGPQLWLSCSVLLGSHFHAKEFPPSSSCGGLYGT